MASQRVDRLLSSYPVISDQVNVGELRVILTELEVALARSLEAPQAIVELGCYIGTTSLFVRRLLDELMPHAAFHVYDSFAGLPDKTGQDSSPAGEQFKTGELAISRKTFELQFKKAGLRPPTIHKGWFADLTPVDIPDNVAFAYLDGDYYESIRDSFRVVTPKLLSGAVIVVDDYANEALPGAAKAVDEWMAVHTSASLRVQTSLAIIRT